MVNDPRPRRRWAASYGLSLLIHALVFLLFVFVAVDIESGTTEIARPGNVQVFEVGAEPAALPSTPLPPPSAAPAVSPVAASALKRPIAAAPPRATSLPIRPHAAAHAAPREVPQPRRSGPALPRPELSRNVAGAPAQAVTAPRPSATPEPQPSPVPVAAIAPDRSSAAGVAELPSLAPVRPTVAPTAAPTTVPTVAPTTVPTVAPTTVPTVAPTLAPVAVPTLPPTAVPTLAPTAVPTLAPTAPPTRAPTAAPTLAPTVAPTLQALAPSIAPSRAPTAAPTIAPTAVPPKESVALATAAPSAAPRANAERRESPAPASHASPGPSAASGSTPGQPGGSTGTPSPARRPSGGAGPGEPAAQSGTAAPRPAEPGPTENPATRSINDRLKALTISGSVDYTPKRVALGDAQSVFDAAMAAYEQRLAPPADILSRTFGFIYERRTAGRPDSLAYVYDVFSIGPIKMCRAWKIVEHPYGHVAEVGAVAGSAGIGGAVAAIANSPDVRHENAGADVQTVVFPCTEKSYTPVAPGSLKTPLPLHPRSPRSPRPVLLGAPSPQSSGPAPAPSLAP